MKKIFLSLAILATLGAKAQLREVTPLKTLGKVQYAGLTVAEITYKEKGDYTLFYYDASLHYIDRTNVIHFKLSDDELATVDSLLKEQCKAAKGSEKQFGLGDNIITVVTERGFGRSGLKVIIAGADRSVGEFHLLESNIDNLFGK